jgi:hypothetical protein
MDEGPNRWELGLMETATSSGSDPAHRESMLKLTIRCHPGVPVDSDELESWLSAQVEELRAGAPRAIIRLSRLTQEFPSSEAGIGWLLELEMPVGSTLLRHGRLAKMLGGLRMLGIQPTALAPLESPNLLGLATAPV